VNGFIKLYRKMLKWEWYTDSVTKDLFIHLLLTANYEDTRYRGVEVKRGQRLTTISQLAKELGLSVRNVRTALEHLKMTNELTSTSTNAYTLITINNFDTYQTPSDKPNDKRPTNDRQTTDKPYTNIKEYKEIKEVKNLSPIIPFNKEQTDEIKSNIEYDYLAETIPTSFLDLVIEVLTECLENDNDWTNYVKAAQISCEDVEYVYENSWVKSDKKIRNPKAYLRTLLLKAPTEREAMEDRMIKRIEV